MGRYDEAVVADLTRAIELAPDLAWAIGERGEDPTGFDGPL